MNRESFTDQIYRAYQALDAAEEYFDWFRMRMKLKEER